MLQLVAVLHQYSSSPSHTADFVTFTTPAKYIAGSIPVIDLTFLFVSGTTYIRFVKDENRLRVYQERSTNGLFGTWSKIGGDVASTVTEGPLTFWDNAVANRAYVFLDEYGGDTTSKVSSPGLR
jgi:hypothetical protein